MNLRNPGTNERGGSFDERTIQLVWEKGEIVFGYDSRQVRKDCCGALIIRTEYGSTNSPHGWEIDHKQPISKGGTDDLFNLQPLQWRNNRGKGDDYPNWTCLVRA